MRLWKADRGDGVGRYLMVWEFDSIARREEYFPAATGGNASDRFRQLTQSLPASRLREYVDVGPHTDYVVLKL
jgi:hypothetical protein